MKCLYVLSSEPSHLDVSVLVSQHPSKVGLILVIGFIRSVQLPADCCTIFVAATECEIQLNGLRYFEQLTCCDVGGMHLLCILLTKRISLFGQLKLRECVVPRVMK